MDKAFDVIFQKEVDAVVVAKTSYCDCGDRFRYKCLCCGEEVYLAAADSQEMIPHFRHRRGNNNTGCGEYLGQPGAVERYVSLRKRDKEYIYFFFNKDRMTFEVCVSFSEQELIEYEKDSGKISLYTKYSSQPFLNIPLSRSDIIPNEKNFFTINEYSNDYYVSFDGGEKKYIYPNIMNKEGKISIFKSGIQGKRYKRLLSNILYTDTNYIALSQKKESIQPLKLMKNIDFEEEISFITENKSFYGIVFSIKHTDYSVRNYFQNQDYQIESSESFDILWPPVFTRDSKCISFEKKVYVYSSFELIPYGNITVDGTSIETIDTNVQKIILDDKTVIYEKNIDVCIEKEKEELIDCVLIEPEVIYTKKYSIPDNYDYFLFDVNGCTKLIYGTLVYLCKEDKIVGYKNGHARVFIYGAGDEMTSTERVIEDILKYYPRTEKFNPDDFMLMDADEVILTYLEGCYRSGKINSIMKKYIEEGRF